MILSLIVSTIVVFFFFLFPVTDFDIWWHMAGGKFMIENWQFPYNDTFSYTAAGQPWNPNSWGFTALSYLGYKVLGLDGLNIIKAIVSTLIFATVAGYLHWKKLLNYFSLTFVTLAFFAIRGGFSLRPHTFAYLIFIIFLILLWEYRERRSYKIIAGLAVTQLIWVNFHASFIFGIMLIGLFLMSEFINRTKIGHLLPFSQKKDEGSASNVFRDFVLGGSILLASLFHIFYGYTYLVRIIHDYFTPSSQIPIREILGASPDDFVSLRGVIIIIGVITVLYYSVRKRRFDLTLATLIFTAIAISTVRFMRDLVLFLTLITPLYIPDALKDLRGVLKGILEPLRARMASLPGYSVQVVFFVFLFVLFLMVKSSGNGVSLGLSSFSYPVSAVEFIQREQLLEKSNGQLYNTYNFGGYLIWANQPHRVAMDGRARPYLGEPFGRYWLNFEGAEMWQDSVERYRITVALMTLPHISGGTIYNISAPMFPREEWALIYYDDIAMTYVRRIEEFVDVIDQYEYKILDPQQMDFTYVGNYIDSQEKFEEVLTEIQRGLALNPESYRLHFTQAYVYSLAGLQEQMITELNKTLEINPRLEAAKKILKQISEPII